MRKVATSPHPAKPRGNDDLRVPNMERRDYLKGLGGIAGAATVGGIGLLATGPAAASDMDINNPGAVTTDDGTILYVAHGGSIRFEWEGLDTEATHGYVGGRTRLKRDGNQISEWRDAPVHAGELGGWGGEDDPDSGKGTTGYFAFEYGEHANSPDYAVAGNSDLKAELDGAAPNATATAADGRELKPGVTELFPVSEFRDPSEDGQYQKTVVEAETIMAVYDGNPNDGGTELVSDTAQGSYTVNVLNREASGDAHVGGNGHVGTDDDYDDSQNHY